MRLDEAIEVLGGLVASRGGEGDDALDVVKDALAGVATPRRDGYLLWVNDERTVLVRKWDSGEVEVSQRERDGDIWGPPIRMVAER